MVTLSNGDRTTSNGGFTNTQRTLEKLKGRNYNFRELIYPEGLGSEINGLGHFILFNINTTRGSRFDKKGNRPITRDDGLSFFGDRAPRSGDFNNSSGNFDPARPSASITSISGATTTRRIATAIAMYMPDNLTTSYSTSWENMEIQAPVALAKTLGPSINDFLGGDFVEGGEKMLSRLGSSVLNAIDAGASATMKATMSRGADAIQGVGGSTELANATSLFRRQFRNPYMEFLFRGVSPRKFTMTFKMMPKNQAETETVREIIKQFKMHALPEFREGGGVFGQFYTYPSEFDITFFSAYNQNSYLYKFSTCALTDIDINYAASGQWSAFKEIETQGAPPTHVEITLSFAELELLTSSRAEEGF